MKRLLLCLTFILGLLLCACGRNVPPESSAVPESTAAEVSAPPAEVSSETEAPAETEKPTATEVPTEKPTEAKALTEKPAKTEASSEKATEEPAETEAPAEIEPATEAAPVLKENSAFLPYRTSGGNPLGVIVNEPFAEEPAATAVWAEGDTDKAYVIPRYVVSRVTLFRIEWDEEGGSSRVPENSADAEDGCAIYGALFRPEGMPMWYVEIQAPDGRTAGLTLYYNGNTGTPPLEYIG